VRHDLWDKGGEATPKPPAYPESREPGLLDPGSFHVSELPRIAALGNLMNRSNLSLLPYEAPRLPVAVRGVNLPHGL
jgi:hypothetical protein